MATAPSTIATARTATTASVCRAATSSAPAATARATAAASMVARSERNRDWGTGVTSDKGAIVSGTSGEARRL